MRTISGRFYVSALDEKTDLTDIGNYYAVHEDMLDADDREYIEAVGQCEFNDDGIAYLSSCSLTELDVPNEAVDFEDSNYDIFAARTAISKLIKPAANYLVFARNCRWDGSSGYKLCSNPLETVARSYDAVITPTAVTSGGKMLTCRESSHDVPLGSTTYIVALTDKEYGQLRNADFAKVEQFMERLVA